MRSVRAAALVPLASLALACVPGLLRVPLQKLSLPGVASQALTEAELRGQVSEAASRFIVTIASTADAISQQARDREVRRRALLWKVRMTPLVQSTTLVRRPTEGLIELLALATAQRQYLTEGSGRELFGEQQGLAREQAVALEAEVSGIAKALLDERQAAELQKQVEQLAGRYPIQGEFMIGSFQSAISEVNASGSFEWVLRLPLAPFRALEGVESGASAIREFNETARQFNELLATLPLQSRWQLELLLYDVESRDSLQSALASLEKVAESSERLSTAAERLPGSLREQAGALLRDSRSIQVELQRGLASLRESLAAVSELSASAKPLVESLERGSANAERAGVAWGDVVRDLRHKDDLPDVGAGQPAPRPFDVLDYERTATQIGAAAAQVRALLADLSQRSDARSWLDFAFWRALLLLAVWYGLRVASGLILARAARDRGFEVTPRSGHSVTGVPALPAPPKHQETAGPGGREEGT